MACVRLRDVPINVRKIVKYCPYRNFGDTCCLHVRESTSSVIKTEDWRFSTASVNFCQTTRRHIPQESIFQSHHHALQISLETKVKK